MSAHDLVIRGGTLVDGNGGTPVVADVAVDGGLVTEVGPDVGRGRREVDAAGAVVAPGFVDDRMWVRATKTSRPATSGTQIAP